MTLSHLERHSSPLRFSLNSIALQPDYVTLVEDRPYGICEILSPTSSLPLLAKTNAPCRIAEHLVYKMSDVIYQQHITMGDSNRKPANNY